jgi:hypothetical protein
MQRTAIKVQAAIIILLMGLLFYGCGSEDLLDENNQRYKTDISFQDGGNEDVLAADAVYVGDCNGDGTFDDPETFTDLYANITITIDDATTPGLEMTGYRVSFSPLRSYDALGNEISPPSVGNYQGNYSVVIPTNSEVSFWITCMEMNLKRYIGTFLDPISDWEFRYMVTIRMDFVDELDEPREITVNRTIYIGSYDNC